MKKILIPTNMTELGDFAYQVAAKIAKNTQSEIDLLYVVSGPQAGIYDKDGKLLESDANDYSEFRKKKKEVKEKLTQYIKDKPAVSNIQVTIGRIDEDILRYVENNNIDLIIMGTEGAHGIKEWIRGSHAEYLTNHSIVPVLSLKCDRSDLQLDKFVFVSDFLEDKKLNLSIVKTLQESFNSTLVLLKVDTHKNGDSKNKDLAIMKNFATQNNLKNVEFNVFSAPSVEEGINIFCANHNIDLVTMGSHQRSGISKLFKENISDDVVNHVYHPILTFPI